MKRKEKKIAFWTEEEGRVIHRLIYRFTWDQNITKLVPLEKVMKPLHEAIFQCAEVNRWHVHRFGASTSWIRVVVQLRPSVRPDQALKILLEGCEKRLVEQFPELAAESVLFEHFAIETPKIDQYSKLMM